MVFAWGLGDAAGLRVAALQGAAGAGAPPGLLRTAGLRLAVLLAVALALAVWAYGAAPQTAVALAAHDATLVAAVVPLLPFGLVALLGDATSVFYAAMLRSLGVLRGPFFAHLGAGLLVLPLAWWLAFPLGMGLAGLLAAHGAAAALRATALAVMYARAARDFDRQAAAGAAP